MWKRCRSTAKRYPGDNRLIVPKSPYRRHCLAPRCRLIASWGRSRSQGLGCSPIKAVRELGLERRLAASPRSNPWMPTGSYRWNPDCHTERYSQGNTEGRPAIMKASDASYLAGFLDGDGSIHFQLGPRLDAQEFLRVAREADAFAALNYSKTKRISAADVEQHLRSKGWLAPVTTSPTRSVGEMGLLPECKSM